MLLMAHKDLAQCGRVIITVEDIHIFMRVDWR